MGRQQARMLDNKVNFTLSPAYDRFSKHFNGKDAVALSLARQADRIYLEEDNRFLMTSYVCSA